MRVLTKIEENRLKVLAKNSISFALIEPTETALNKGIMDATGSVRKYLKESGLHDYEIQGQGAKENGVNLAANIFTETEIIKTSASLYRPKAKGKGGDPRIWFSGLQKNASPNDILVLISFDKAIQILNLTRLSLDTIANSTTKNHINELIAVISYKENETSIELLYKLKEIAAQGFVKSDVNSDTGIGRTLESLLGIEMNSSKSPDYKGIELKSFRDSRSTRKGLFAKTPDWELSKFKSRIEILDNFGYWEKGIFRLYNTIRATGKNAQGLILKVDYEKDWLRENSDKPKIGDFLVWEFNTLRDALIKKHKETFWVSAESKIIDNHEHFLFNAVEHTKNPMVDKLEMLLEIGAITMDYPIKRMPDGKVIDKGCNFKLKAGCMDLLFPPSEKYSLLEN